MKYIITGGAMSTKFDEVRKLINSSTGKLAGTFIDCVLKDGNEVVFIHTEMLNYDNSDVRSIEVRTPSELLEKLKLEITDRCVVIHAMAVSDFKYNSHFYINDLINEFIAHKDNINSLKDGIELIDSLGEKTSKISSKEDILIYLKRDIKVVDRIKKINPECFLVSFKLLAGINYEELITAASAQKVRTHSDIVVANIKEEINNQQHNAIIIMKDKQEKVTTKKAIAKKVIDYVKEYYE